MKLTRKRLRRLIIETINETRIKPGIPGIGDSEYDKMQVMASASPAQADQLAGAFGYEGDFVQDMADYNTAGRITIETVSSMGPEGRYELDVQIPHDMVDGVIEAHQQVMQGGGISAEDLFRSQARSIFNYIDNQVTDGVYEYAIKVGGYRAQEYNDAMNAVGEYL